MTPAMAVDEGLRACTRTALHLEMRDAYTLDDPDLVAWRNGYVYDPAARDTYWRPWLDLMAETTGRGVIVRRARIVSVPVSEYIKYEYDTTMGNVAAGEQVRWLPRRHATGIALPGNDFWLFDSEILLVNHFNGNGDWLEAERITEPEVTRFCAAAFEAVWNQAVPHGDFQPI
jgi:hypothetical protein